MRSERFGGSVMRSVKCGGLVMLRSDLAVKSSSNFRFPELLFSPLLL